MRRARPAPRIGMAAAMAVSAVAATAARAADISLPPGAIAPTAAPSVAPFFLAPGSPDRRRAQQCLAAAVYYEAADQPLAGRQAVAQVVLNRVRHPLYPKSVCGVVFQGASRPGCQFTFACDGALARTPSVKSWADAEAVAAAALDGFVADSVSASTHYHALYVRPAWSARLTPTQRIGAHQFYRFPGLTGEAAQLVGAYAGSEPDAATLLRPPSDVRLAALTPRAHAPASRPVPTAATFTVWGLGVAQATPERDGAVHLAWRTPS